jgi:ribosomal protein S27E
MVEFPPNETDRGNYRVPCSKWLLFESQNAYINGGNKRMAETAYCVKCKEKREMKDAHQITMKNGRPAMQGACVVCGTKLTRIMGGSAKQ